MLVTNDIIIHLDRKTHCATMFVDLSKASDSLEQTLLLDRLSDVGLGDCVQELACRYISLCLYRWIQVKFSGQSPTVKF